MMHGFFFFVAVLLVAVSVFSWGPALVEGVAVDEEKMVDQESPLVVLPGDSVMDYTVCTHYLRDYRCPGVPFHDGARVCTPNQGWWIGHCELQVEQGGVAKLIGYKIQEGSIIQVFRGGAIMFATGQWDISCHECGECVRAIQALGSTVEVYGGASVKISDSCATMGTSEVVGADEDEVEMLSHSDGGAILSLVTSIYQGGKVNIENSRADYGSGGAIATRSYFGYGSLEIENASARYNGGAMALLLSKTADSFVKIAWRLEADPAVVSIADHDAWNLVMVAAKSAQVTIFDRRTLRMEYSFWPAPKTPFPDSMDWSFDGTYIAIMTCEELFDPDDDEMMACIRATVKIYHPRQFEIEREQEDGTTKTETGLEMDLVKQIEVEGDDFSTHFSISFDQSCTRVGFGYGKRFTVIFLEKNTGEPDFVPAVIEPFERHLDLDHNFVCFAWGGGAFTEFVLVVSQPTPLERTSLDWLDISMDPFYRATWSPNIDSGSFDGYIAVNMIKWSVDGRSVAFAGKATAALDSDLPEEGSGATASPLTRSIRSSSRPSSRHVGFILKVEYAPDVSGDADAANGPDTNVNFGDKAENKNDPHFPALTQTTKPFTNGKEVTAMAFGQAEWTTTTTSTTTISASTSTDAPPDFINWNTTFIWATVDGEGVNRVWIKNRDSPLQTPLTLKSRITALRFENNHKDPLFFIGASSGSVRRARTQVNEKDTANSILITQSKLKNVVSTEGQGGALYVRDSSNEPTICSLSIYAAQAMARGAAITANGGIWTFAGLAIHDSVESVLSKNVVTLDNVKGVKFKFGCYDGWSEGTKTRTGLDILGPGIGTVIRMAKGADHSPCDEGFWQNDTRPRTECPLGHQLIKELAKDSGSQSCNLVCEPCAGSEAFSPVLRECVPCPLGLDCTPPADLRHPKLLEHVEDEIVELEECSSDLSSYERVLAGPVGSVYFLDENRTCIDAIDHSQSYREDWHLEDYACDPICHRIRCDELDRELGSEGCQTCAQNHGRGWAAKRDDICHPILVQFKDKPKAVEHKKRWTIQGHFTSRGSVECKVTPKKMEEQGIYRRWFQRLEGTNPVVAEDKFEGKQLQEGESQDAFHLYLGMMKHSTYFEGVCVIHQYGRESRTEIEPFHTGFSFVQFQLDWEWFISIPLMAVTSYMSWRAQRSGGHMKTMKPWVLVLFIAYASWLITQGAVMSVELLNLEGDEGETYLVWFALASLTIVLAHFGGLRWRMMTRERDAAIDAQLDQALQLVEKLQFPVVLIPASDFLSIGGLKSHEELRRLDLLKFFDTKAAAEKFLEEDGNFAIFFSHQWTAWEEPDHTNKQYEAMCRAIHYIVQRETRELESIYCWIDYCCISQEVPKLQELAINSLPLYASLLSSFVIVCPDVPHKDVPEPCDRNAYLHRGWCRAEHLCHFVSCGGGGTYLVDHNHVACFDSMYLLSNFNHNPSLLASDQAAEQEMQNVAIHVFAQDSSFTCCRKLHRNHLGRVIPCDRESLVLPMLGLYGEIYRRRRREDYEEIFQAIDEERDIIFPSHYTYTTSTGSEIRALFDGLIEKLETKIDGLADLPIDFEERKNRGMRRKQRIGNTDTLLSKIQSIMPGREASHAKSEREIQRERERKMTRPSLASPTTNMAQMSTNASASSSRNPPENAARARGNSNNSNNSNNSSEHFDPSPTIDESEEDELTQRRSGDSPSRRAASKESISSYGVQQRHFSADDIFQKKEPNPTVGQNMLDLARGIAQSARFLRAVAPVAEEQPVSASASTGATVAPTVTAIVSNGGPLVTTTASTDAGVSPAGAPVEGAGTVPDQSHSDAVTESPPDDSTKDLGPESGGELQEEQLSSNDALDALADATPAPAPSDATQADTAAATTASLEGAEAGTPAETPAVEASEETVVVDDAGASAAAAPAVTSTPSAVPAAATPSEAELPAAAPSPSCDDLAADPEPETTSAEPSGSAGPTESPLPQS